MVIVGDIDDVERFAVFAVAADVVEDLLDRPIAFDRDEVGRHEAADRAGAVRQERAGDALLFGAEQHEQPLDFLGRLAFEQGGAVVWRHAVEQPREFLDGHLANQLFVRGGRDVLEAAGGEFGIECG